jgi:hypothetical protein
MAFLVEQLFSFNRLLAICNIKKIFIIVLLVNSIGF